MPAAYAHITIANLMQDRLVSLPESLEEPYNKYKKYCELGAVSPDYPYLDIISPKSKEWADIMHHYKTIDFVREGVKLLIDFEDEAKQKVIAWLLGFASHVVADCVVHPVVNNIAGGKYDDGPEIQKAHRLCEMSQDLYIYESRLGMGGYKTTEHLDTGIKTCSAPGDPDKLDPDINKCWMQILKNLHGTKYHASPPNPDKWHNNFCFIMDKFVEEGFDFFPLARHVACKQGLTYPDRPDDAHIVQVPTPTGPMEYDLVFNKALDEVTLMWEKMGNAIFESNPEMLAKLPNLDLDTGVPISEELYYWGNLA